MIPSELPIPPCHERSLPGRVRPPTPLVRGAFSTTPHRSGLILLPSFRRMLVATDRLTRADWNATSHDVQKDGFKEDKSKSKRQIPWIPASAGMTNQNRQTLPHWSRQTLAPHSGLTLRRDRPLLGAVPQAPVPVRPLVPSNKDNHGGWDNPEEGLSPTNLNPQTIPHWSRQSLAIDQEKKTIHAFARIWRHGGSPGARQDLRAIP